MPDGLSYPVPHQDAPVLAAAPAPVPALNVDWPYWTALRPRVYAEYPDFPKYLLQPEVHALIAGARHDAAACLLDVLWHTGARISEALRLTPRDLVFDTPRPYIVVPRSKRRSSRGTAAARTIPVAPEAQPFKARLRRYITGQRLRLDEPLWPITRQTADNWLKAAAADAGLALPAGAGCHALRHSFAVHCLVHYRPLVVISRWLGHASLASTEVYTRLFLIDTNHFMDGMQF
ncbi:site-specific integrase [Alkalilimnicola ehrlichii]|nr:site-specific integrase [Alkalilimnicola ehrlichii]